MLRCQDIKNTGHDVDKEATRILSQVIKRKVNPNISMKTLITVILLYFIGCLNIEAVTYILSFEHFFTEERKVHLKIY